MARAKVTKLEPRRRIKTSARALPSPGLHAGVLELVAGDRIEVRFSSGERVRAELDPGVASELVGECLRDRRTVLVAVDEQRARVLGALQTGPSMAVRTRPGTLALDADAVELTAERELRLRVGKSVLVLEADGSIRASGATLTLRLAEAMRVLAPNVELP